ncbi:MAG: hypothetical protein WDW38_001825 [Sanguina aurantia]
MDRSSETPKHVEPRVLSIQSHVVHGNVGNKCATFPLQLLGLEVDSVNSVQFSNHTGYPVFKGDIFNGSHLQQLVSGLESNGLLKGYTHLLTGYIGSESLLQAVVDVLRRLRELNPDITYVCDPVMGDDGKLYVKQEMVELFRTQMVPLASIMVPNQYEASLLIGSPVSTAAEAMAACQKLHALGPHSVVITSLTVPDDPDSLMLLASTTKPQLGGASVSKLQMCIPRIPAYFTGTGDLLAALLLARIDQYPGDLAQAVEMAVAGLQAVLLDTAAHCGVAALSGERTAAVSAARELRLVANQRHIVSPVVTLRCTPFSSGSS